MSDDEELKQLLRASLETSQESLDILKGLRSKARWSSFFLFIKWTAIIGLSLGAYYWIQPFLEKSLGMMDQAIGTMEQVRQTGDVLQENITPASDLLQKAQDLLK